MNCRLRKRTHLFLIDMIKLQFTLGHHFLEKKKYDECRVVFFLLRQSVGCILTFLLAAFLVFCCCSCVLTNCSEQQDYHNTTRGKCEQEGNTFCFITLLSRAPSFVNYRAMETESFHKSPPGSLYRKCITTRLVVFLHKTSLNTTMMNVPCLITFAAV